MLLVILAMFFSVTINFVYFVDNVDNVVVENVVNAVLNTIGSVVVNLVDMVCRYCWQW